MSVPAPGRKGGNIIAAGTFDDILKSDSITADYLTAAAASKFPKRSARGRARAS